MFDVLHMDYIWMRILNRPLACSSIGINVRVVCVFVCVCLCVSLTSLCYHGPLPQDEVMVSSGLVYLRVCLCTLY